MPLGRSSSKKPAKPRMAPEEIVEIVGDAASELPHGFHLLRVNAAFLEPLRLGHVTGIDDDAVNSGHIAASRAVHARCRHVPSW